MKKKGMSVKFITQAAVIAAIYVVLVVIFNYISFGPVQFRIAEALTILPYFTPAAIPGLFVGCIIANILGGAIVCGIIGMILLYALTPVRHVIFGDEK